MATHVDYLKAALRHPVNISLVVLLAAVGVISTNLLPLFALVVVELFCAGVLPVLPAFRRMVDAKQNATQLEERQLAAQSGIDALPSDLRRRAMEFHEKSRDILKHPAVARGGQAGLMTRVLDNLDSAGARHVDLLNRISLLRLELGTDDSADAPSLKDRQEEIRQQLQSRMEAAEKELAGIEGAMSLFRKQLVLLSDSADGGEAVGRLLDEFDIMQETTEELGDSLASFDRKLST